MQELLDSLYDDNLDAQRRMNTAPTCSAYGGGIGGSSNGGSGGTASSSAMIGIGKRSMHSVWCF